MPLILGTNSIKDTGFDVANSCRFSAASSDSLSRTLGSGNQKTFTISLWFKPSKINFTDGGGGADRQIIGQTASSYWRVTIYRDFRIQIYGATTFNFITTQVFRDFSAWYNLIITVDTTQSTEANRVKIYINGSQVTAFDTSNYPSQNQDLPFNNGQLHSIGRSTSYGGYDYYDGYMAEVVLLDGTAADPTSFGEFDSDSPTIWKPKDVSGLTFGTNGFYLDFEDSSALGNDAAGSNNFTVNNLTAIDQSTDTCTNNFATLNPLAKGSSSTFSEGNLKETVGSATYNTSTSTIGVSSGKWYWEYKLPSGGLNYVLYGITSVESSARDADVMTNFKTSYAKTSYAGEFRYNTGGGAYSTDTSGFSADSTGDIVKIALDLDNNFIYVGNGNSWYNSGNPESGASGTGAAKAVVAGLTYFPMMIVYNNSLEINFGSPPYSESGGNSDGDGYGNFNQAVPSGYYSLNTKNLAEYG